MRATWIITKHNSTLKTQRNWNELNFRNNKGPFGAFTSVGNAEVREKVTKDG